MNDRFKFRVIRGENPFTPTGTVLHFALGDEVGFGQGDIIEQCTGLKDKNGNLIYEGDIVKSMIRTGYIKWNKGDMTWFVYVLKSNEIIALNGYLDGELEIIGNIHEQAEQKDTK